VSSEVETRGAGVSTSLDTNGWTEGEKVNEKIPNRSSAPLRVLSVASEAFPLIKTGGLADVVGALPGALAPHGVAVTTLVPGYPAVLHAIGKARTLRKTELLGAPARLLKAEAGGLDLIVLDAPAYFVRDGGPYGDATGVEWPDNWRRFAALGRAAADIAQGAIQSFRPALVHAHDWQAAMALAYLRYDEDVGVPGIITVHNIAFQGKFGTETFAQLGLPPHAYAVDGVEYYGGVGFLKAGLQAASAITTVSPSYAEEIRTAAYGMGLEGLIAARGDVVHGIVNGIDTAIWDPATDPYIPAKYALRALGGRRRNRAAVEQAFGLDPGAGPIHCVISRLTWQKGMDVLATMIDELVLGGGRLAVLGSGDAALEQAFRAAAQRHPGRVGVRIGYDEPASHLLQAGADTILIPSRFEPCGLTQLYGLRYGCVPVVARTGGLADTVIDANEAAVAAGVATGFQFRDVTPPALRGALTRVARAFADPAGWAAIQRQGMKADFSWGRSGARYAALYRALLA